MPDEMQIPKLTTKVAKKLRDRIRQINLYAHSYAFFLNFQEGSFGVSDLLRFANKEGLNGIDVHIDSGGKRSLKQKSEKDLKDIREYAKKLGLGINLEISCTSKNEVDLVVRIAKILGVKNIRVYIRYEGHVLNILKKAIKDFKYISKIAGKNKLLFVLEQHEVLKSNELVGIINKIKNSRIRLLFDFGNMVDADEDPIDALKTMSPYITHVHMKGVNKDILKRGYGQMGVLEGEDELPQAMMLFDLLLLGKSSPQVKFYALEQEVGFYAPPFRFDNEKKNPLIPSRKPSITHFDKNKSIKENLLSEKRNAHKQVKYVKNLLKQMETVAKTQLH